MKLLSHLDFGEEPVWKAALASFSGVAIALLLSYFLSDFLKGAGNNSLYGLLVSGVFFAAFAVLQAMFLRAKIYRIGAVLLETAALGVFFLERISWTLLLGAGLILFLLWLSLERGFGETENHLKIKFKNIERAVAPKIFTALAIFVSLTYLNVVGGTDQTAILSKKNFEAFLRPSESIVQWLVVREFSFNMRITKLVESLAAVQLGDKLAQLPPGARQEVFNQLFSAVESQAADYGISFKKNETILDILYGYVMQLLKKIPPSFLFTIPLSAAILVFLTAKGFSIVLRPLAIALSYGLYRLSLASGFAKIATEPIYKEVILLN